MSIFLRLLSDADKSFALITCCSRIRGGINEPKSFEVLPEAFDVIPGKPFAYWPTDSLRALFCSLPQFEDSERFARQGLSTADDFRFARCWWEVDPNSIRPTDGSFTSYKTDAAIWYPLLKGGGRSAFVSSFDLVLNYQYDGREVKAWVSSLYGNTGWSKNIFNTELYFRRGFSWALRSSKFSPSAVPDGCIFSASRYQAFTGDGDLPWVIASLNSSAASYLLRMCAENFERPKYVVGIVSTLPFPSIAQDDKDRLKDLFYEAAASRSQQLSYDETSHYFFMPAGLTSTASIVEIRKTFESIQEEIDEIVNRSFALSDEDIRLVQGSGNPLPDDQLESDAEENDDQEEEMILCGKENNISWAFGVAIGRFDWRFVTNEREAPPKSDPFSPLPILSPGMLPGGAKPFHIHGGVLVDDQGHPNDIARLIEEVLNRVKVIVPDDVRQWLQRDFFVFHLQRYSKSRRKAPIYWPLSTGSGSYTLWIYYPSLSNQTLYTAINDFVEPKLKQVGSDVTALRNRGSARTRDDEKRFEALQAFELELIEFRDTLQKIASTYKPNLNDGVQISAAPLWPLFRHKPWQKVLKDTWAKLEKGDYDWSHLAMNYWPDRVREKCKADKSLAIAHGLEQLYVEPEAKPKKTRGRKKEGDAE